ncbi:hypothetical protein GMRT_12670 [Giardia muris]|uniref:BPI-like protein n=1 Tax=Giardia muris TaxID=5742 RepID=A0A4Z1SPV4_GIAMU|nr:hypothetical protein GMRT_12670 [Giardia muris]|eukprot:TNJ27862.1 hypothetical protein GMRT_12670 [Giardia muris]
MLILLITGAILAKRLCGIDQYYPDAPLSIKNTSLSLRFSERGLEKFCQMGFGSLPSIISSLPSFGIGPIDLGFGTGKVEHFQVKSFDIKEFNVSITDDGYVRVDLSKGLMTIAFDFRLKVMFLEGTVRALFQLTDVFGSLETTLIDHPECFYRYALQSPLRKGILSYEKLVMDFEGLDSLGSTIASLIQGNYQVIDGVVKNVILPAFKDVLMTLITMMFKDDYTQAPSSDNSSYTDTRHLAPIRFIERKAITMWPGYAYVTNETPVNPELYKDFLHEPPISLPNITYTNAEFEVVIDRQAFNSMYYIVHKQDGFTLMNQEVKDTYFKELESSGQDTSFLTGATVDFKCLQSPNMTAIHAAASRTMLHYEYTIHLTNGTDLTGLVSFALKTTVNHSHTRIGDLLTHLHFFLEATRLTNLVLSAGDGHPNSILLPSILDALLKEILVPFFNNLMTTKGVNIRNGNFINYKTLLPLYFPDDQKIVIIGDVQQNPIFA